MTWNGLQTHKWHHFHSLTFSLLLHFLPVHPYFYPSIFIFTHPNDGWTGLYIKLCGPPYPAINTTHRAVAHHTRPSTQHIGLWPTIPGHQPSTLGNGPSCPAINTTHRAVAHHTQPIGQWPIMPGHQHNTSGFGPPYPAINPAHWAMAHHARPSTQHIGLWPTIINTTHRAVAHHTRPSTQHIGLWPTIPGHQHNTLGNGPSCPAINTTHWAVAHHTQPSTQQLTTPTLSSVYKRFPKACPVTTKMFPNRY